jgi:hypothetical protein
MMMTHPHIAKLLAESRIDEMLVTAERHRLRRLATRHRARTTKQVTGHPRQAARPSPPFVDLSTMSNADPDRDDKDQYANA